MTDAETARTKGERVSPTLSITFFPGQRIEKGEWIVPIKHDSPASREHAALLLAVEDLKFALESLKAADEIGLPDAAHVQSKALIFSAVIAYARPFKTGVREIKLNPDMFAPLGGFDSQLHEHILSVRDKHVAHSVNEFENARTVGVAAGLPGKGWRPVGVGSTINQVTGFNRTLVHQAISQISSMLELLDQQAKNQRTAIFEEFRKDCDAGKKLEMAPMATFPDRSRAGRRRD